MMPRTRTLVFAAGLLAAAAATALGTQQSRESFPHRQHEGLFPFCTGCHQPESMDREARFPKPELCARCHDGEQQPRVEWSVPARPASNLVFDHGLHYDAALNEESPVVCQTCHNRTGALNMRVVPAEGARCVQCHAHEAQDHTLDAECSTCHVPLAETTLSLDRIRRLPQPTDHEQADFLASAHGRSAESSVVNCSVCHTRERCESCHVNAATVREIAAIPEAPAALDLPAWEPEYPAPPSHEAEFFSQTHGDVASGAECSTCHTRESCTACHVGPPNRVVTALPERSAQAAKGVTLERVAPLTHASPSFAVGHGPRAAADGAACAQCHTANACADCHESPGRTAYHPDDFVMRHSTAAYGGRLECSNCHDTRVFCQDCHQKSGFQPVGRLGAGFHTAEPFWLLRHGGAARRGLEACTTCHTQNNCLQCHSQTGAFRISPHGRDFDARRAQDRNAAICRACHIRDPFAGGG